MKQNMYVDNIGPPVTAAQMRDLKALEDEKNRWKVINNIISSVYRDAIQFAKINTETRFVYHPTGFNGGDDFLINNKRDIISKLELLFPECSVSYRTYAYVGNNETHDITDLDEKRKKCFSSKSLRIVIDWS